MGVGSTITPALQVGKLRHEAVKSQKVAEPGFKLRWGCTKCHAHNHYTLLPCNCITLGTWFTPGYALGTQAQRIKASLFPEKAHALVKTDRQTETDTQKVTGTQKKGEKRPVPIGNQGKLHKGGGFEQGIEEKVGVC